MGMYGVDVAQKRTDDLDKKMLAYVGEHPGCLVLDLGCGKGGQSKRLAAAGSKVLGIDIIDRDTNSEQFDFICADVRDLSTVVKDQKFNVASFQRTIHYLPYIEAKKLLQLLLEIVSDKLFISVSGLESDIGLNYKDKDKPVSDRFCKLSINDSQTFSIAEPICLYTPEEFIVLLQDSGWQIDECWVSAFGNTKAVCTH